VALPRTLLPIYSLGATWTFTPKLSLNLSAARSISPPTTVIANSQTSENVAVNLTYQMTPKISVTAGGSADYSESSFTSATPEISPFFVNTQKTYSLSTSLNYSMTPFLSAGLSAAYSERVSSGLITPQDIVTVSLNYRPY
jgi:outer membrane receptor protein involved in Fe transport